MHMTADTSTGAVLLCLALVPISAVTAVVPELATGQPQIVLSLPEGSRPEGIAVNRSGTAFVGNRQFREGQPTINQILRLTGNGTAVVFASLPDSTRRLRVCCPRHTRPSLGVGSASRGVPRKMVLALQADPLYACARPLQSGDGSCTPLASSLSLPPL